jgi:hypothetical protein
MLRTSPVQRGALVVFSQAKKKLDGDLENVPAMRWHRIEDLQRDIARQEVLERVGWRFIRIRGSAFYRNPDTAMASVFEKLRQAGIVPLSVDAPCAPQNESELVERVRRRAAEILVKVEEIAMDELTKRRSSPTSMRKRDTRAT